MIATVVVGTYNTNVEPKVIDYQGVSTMLLPALTGDLGALTLSAYADTLRSHHAAVERFVNDRDPGAHAQLISYLPMPRSVAGLRGSPWTQLAEVAQPIEDKRNLAKILEASGAAVVPNKQIQWPCSPEAWRDVWRSFDGGPVVAQALGPHVGGRGTFVLSAERDIDTIAWPGPDDGGTLKVMPRLGRQGYSVLLFVAPTKDDCEVIVLAFSTQLAYLSERKQITYQGNLLSTDFDSRRASSAREAVTRIAQYLYREHGLAGPFGMDFVFGPDGTAYVVDINPRATGLLPGLIASYDAHYEGDSLMQRVFCQREPEEFRALADRLAAALAQRILSRRLFLAAARHDFSPRPARRPGIYTLSVTDGTPAMTFARESWSVAGIEDGDTEVFCFPLVMGPYRAGETVMIGELYAHASLEARLQEEFGEGLGLALLEMMIRGSGLTRESLDSL